MRSVIDCHACCENKEESRRNVNHALRRIGMRRGKQRSGDIDSDPKPMPETNFSILIGLNEFNGGECPASGNGRSVMSKPTRKGFPSKLEGWKL